jgi:hypothetical protein
MWAAFKRSWLWQHRTKTLGGLGVGAAALQNFLSSHHIWRVPDSYEGAAVGVLGGLVGAVGIYNSLSDYFGWADAT